MRLSFSLFAFLVSLARAQDYSQNPVGWASFSGGASTCNGTFAQANGSGIFHYNPGVTQGSGAGARNETTGKTLPVGIGVTLTAFEDIKPIEYSLWFSSGGADYSNDLALGYDVCGFGVGPLSPSINARGQTDNGSCYDLLDQPCVDALETAAQTAALQLTLVASSGLNSNSLSGICQSIKDTLNANLPRQCSSSFTNETELVISVPLTRYNTSTANLLNSTCTMADGFESYSLLATVYGVDNTNKTYDALAQVLGPILAVWMPVANAARTSYLTSAKAGMLCAHIDNYTAGSRIPPLLSTNSTMSPSTTATIGTTASAATTAGGGLSSGAIAGVVVGILLALAVLAVLVWFVMRRRATKGGRAKAHEIGGHSASDSGDQAFLKETTVVSELDVLNSTRGELPSDRHDTHFAEAYGDSRQAAEVQGTEIERQELSGSKRGSDIWDWRRNNGMAHELEG